MRDRSKAAKMGWANRKAKAAARAEYVRQCQAAEAKAEKLRALGYRAVAVGNVTYIPDDNVGVGQSYFVADELLGL